MPSAGLKKPPLVTVVVATRNRDELLARALLSIDRQAYPSVEIVLIDDGSSQAVWDRQDEIVRHLKRPVRIIRSNAPDTFGTGPSAARNRGIVCGEGEYVAFLDDDDEWSSDDHLAVAVDALSRCGCDLFFANMKGYRGEKLVMDDWFPLAQGMLRYPSVVGMPSVRKLDMRGLIPVMRHHIIHPDSMVAKRSLLMQVKGFWERVGSAEDWELMMRLIDAASGVLYRSDSVARYRLPEGDSISLRNSPLEKKLQHLIGAVRIQLICRNREVQRCAAAKEAWCHRELALFALQDGSYRTAKRQALLACLKYPTMGGVAFLARVICGGIPKLQKDPRIGTVAPKTI